MQDLLNAVRFQAEFRRFITPRDVLKLIFQNEFAGGHLITDRENALSRLRAEIAAAAPLEGMPLIEEIGNGLCRVNLNAPDFAGIRSGELCDAFIATAQSRVGSYDALWDKLMAVTEATRDGRCGFAAFTAEDLYFQASTWRADGYPLLSHTGSYRRRYHPAYRVVALDAACALRDAMEPR